MNLVDLCTVGNRLQRDMGDALGYESLLDVALVLPVRQHLAGGVLGLEFEPYVEGVDGAGWEEVADYVVGWLNEKDV